MALKIFTKILWVLFIFGVAVLAIVLMLVGFNIKHVATIYSHVQLGKNELEQSLTQAQSSDFKSAHDTASAAVNDFNVALTETKAIRLGPIGYISIAAGYKNDAEHLVQAGTSLAQAMEDATLYAYNLGDVIKQNSTTTFSQLPLDERRKILENIYNSDTALGTVDQKLGESLTNLQAIQSLSWLGPLSVRLEDLKTKIAEGQSTIKEASPLTRLLPSLLGYPDTEKYLLILQNSDELRPTGGFIGTFGIIQTKDGDFERFETHDIYHLDIPVQDKVLVTPPAPLIKYLGVNHWYMRDANWSPDWPTSAEKILWFYSKENAAQAKPDPISDFNGVIAITPELITDLMKFTGPIVIGKDTYTSDNFVNLLQYKVEKQFIQLGIPDWQRKEVIGDIAKQIKQKLLDNPLGRWPEMIRLISDNVTRKNVLLYSRDQNLQKLIIDQGWGGQVRQDWGDYLMVVDANMAALKTDAVMDRQISYTLEETSSGLKALVTLRYSHNGHYDWKTSDYRTYTRIYVPGGSHLITADGFTQGNVDTGEEFGKTWFGAFIQIKPGQIGQMTFEYELPQAMADNLQKYHNYRLTIQKQPGKQVSRLAVDLKFLNKIKSYSPANFYSEASSQQELQASGDLLIDRSYFVNF